MAAQHKRDYYEVLGLDRSAAQEQIKQAYRQLAMQWHPDRNSAADATDRFKEIAEAYAVLSDETKRRAYDTTGHAGVSERWSTEDIFRDFDFGDFFGGRMGDVWSVFGDMFPGRTARSKVSPQGADLRYDLHLTLDDAAKGGERVIKLTRSDICKTCGGNGAKPGTKPVSCSECHGTGEKQQVRADKTMRVVTLTTCTRCNGRGLFIESPCVTCKGSGLQFLPHSIKVQIPAGVEHGMLLRLAGQGEAGPQGAPPGDLLVRIYIQPHATLKRDGDDLYAVMPISLPDAALGTKVTVPCLEDEKVIVTVPPGTQNGTMLRARGKGMPRLHGRGKGDLYVVVEVKTPTDLTSRQRELLREFKMEASKKAAATGS
ncbi:MAG: Chaperone protein DnaJ [Deltaproteobacteria bacterium]|nr:Chaperone protein DnaJ [Deltaproteobacteria bacterium]